MIITARTKAYKEGPQGVFYSNFYNHYMGYNESVFTVVCGFWVYRLGWSLNCLSMRNKHSPDEELMKLIGQLYGDDQESWTIWILTYLSSNWPNNNLIQPSRLLFHFPLSDALDYTTVHHCQMKHAMNSSVDCVITTSYIWTYCCHI